MATEDESPWQSISEHALLHVYSFLGASDRYSAALACKHWSSCFDNASLWKHFTFRFKSEEDTDQLQCIQNYGNLLRSVEIFVNPQLKKNCENAVTVLTELARCSERRLESLLIWFTDENPLFFQGKIFIDALAELFGPPDPNIDMVSTLKVVNLGGFSIVISELLLKLLASNHPNLEVLNIQNTALTCSVSPNGLISVVQQCRKLKELSCFSLSSSDDLLRAFMEKDRAFLQYLSFKCRREDKFHVPTSRDTWDALVKKLPKLRVSLLFDETIEQDDIQNVLQPPIPLASLSLRTMCELHNELALVDLYYSETLERLEIMTKGTPELQSALLKLLQNATKLQELHCLCGLSEDTLRKIKKLKPHLKKYTLKTEEEFASQTSFAFVGNEACEVAIAEAPGVFENLTLAEPDIEVAETESLYQNDESVPEVDGSGSQDLDTSQSKEVVEEEFVQEQDESKVADANLRPSDGAEKVEFDEKIQPDVVSSEQASAPPQEPVTSAHEQVDLISQLEEDFSLSKTEEATSDQNAIITPDLKEDNDQHLNRPEKPEIADTIEVSEPVLTDDKPTAADVTNSDDVTEEQKPLAGPDPEERTSCPKPDADQENATPTQENISTDQDSEDTNVTNQSEEEKKALADPDPEVKAIPTKPDADQENANPTQGDISTDQESTDTNVTHQSEEEKVEKDLPKSDSSSKVNIIWAVGICTVAVVAAIFLARASFASQ